MRRSSSPHLLLLPQFLELRLKVVLHVGLLMGSFHCLHEGVRGFSYKGAREERGSQTAVEGYERHILVDAFDLLDFASEMVHVIVGAIIIPFLDVE